MRKHLIIASAAAAVLAAVLIVLLLNYDIIPRSGSPEHASIDQVMKIQALIAMVFFSIVVVIIVYSLIVFRRRRRETGDGRPIRGNYRLEVIWTAIPLAVVIGLSIYAGIVLADITRPGEPQTELEVNVAAFRFGWMFNYPQYENAQSFILGLEVNRRTVFHMQSMDVVHSFWIPEFGPKQDVVPGLTTVLRYTPDTEGQFTVLCAELCGFGHPIMQAPVNVMSSGEFEDWVAAQPPATPTPSPEAATTPAATSQLHH